MKTDKKLQIVKYGYIVLSILTCILGAVLIAFPDVPLKILCRIGGTVLIIFGCVKILGYLSKDPYQLAFQFDLALGILLIGLGLILIIRAKKFTYMVCTAFGLLIFVDSLMKIQTSVEAKNFGIPKWWLILVTATLTAILGLLLLVQFYRSSKIAMILLGISALGEGLLNLVTVLVAVKTLRKNFLELI